MLMQHALVKEDRDKYTYLLRWFQTIVNQKIVKEVIGEVVLCEKLQPLKKEDMAEVAEAKEVKEVTEKNGGDKP